MRKAKPRNTVGAVRGARADLPVPEPMRPTTCAENTRRRSKFRAGSIVQLVTGSFPMAVTGIERDGRVKVIYCHPGGSYLQADHLPEACLVAARAPTLPRKGDLKEMEIPF
ncbi:hypothetical protein ACWX0K_10890 [Nitrobacteraceae bacterium UC4446_H13]